MNKDKHSGANKTAASGSQDRLASDGRSDFEKTEKEESKFCDGSYSAINTDAKELSDEEEVFHEALSEIHDSKYDNMADFINMLDESDSPIDKSMNIEDSMKNLDSLISNISVSVTESRTSTPRKNLSQDGLSSSKAFPAFCDNQDISSVSVIENTRIDDGEKSAKQAEGTTFEIIDITNSTKTDQENMTEFDVIEGPESRFDKTKSKCVQETHNTTEFLEISLPRGTVAENNDQDSSIKTTGVNDLTDLNESNNCTESFKSVENWFGESSKLQTDSNTTNTNTYPEGILVNKGQTEEDGGSNKRESVGSSKGDKSVRFAAATSMQKPADVIAHSPAGVGVSALKQRNESPTVGM